LSNEKLKKVDGYRKRFMDAVNDDMNFAAGLAVVWEMLKSNVPNYDKLDLLLDWDQILGLGLDNIEETEVPEEIKKLGADREGLRLAGRYIEADELRMEIEKKGWILDDTKSGTRYKKITNAK
jgi:cysteinyl-tRNA synthetase